MQSLTRRLLLITGDVAMLFGAFFMMLPLAFPAGLSAEIIDTHLPPFFYVFLIWICVFFLFNFYQTELIKPTIPYLKKIGLAALTALSASTILFYLVPYFGITPKTNLVIFSGVFLLLFLTWRRFFYNIFSKYFRTSVVFITDQAKDKSYTRELLHYMENYPQSGFRVLGVFHSLGEYLGKAGDQNIETLIISRNVLNDDWQIKNVYNKIENILDLTYTYENILGKIPVDSIDEIWVLDNIRKTKKNFYQATSYVFSILLILVLLIILSPLLLIIALLIKLEDGGSVFYIQPRVGKNGRIFNFYKFRSMVVGADKNGAEWTNKNDPRITKIGRLIRKVHLDEVPQFLNILKGDMVLVGPRPEIPSFEEKLEKEIKHYGLRNIITPGFTGWAQIKYRNARGLAESKEKFEYDLFYIKNRNIFMDLGILFRTIVIIFTHD